MYKKDLPYMTSNGQYDIKPNQTNKSFALFRKLLSKNDLVVEFVLSRFF